MANPRPLRSRRLGLLVGTACVAWRCLGPSAFLGGSAGSGSARSTHQQEQGGAHEALALTAGAAAASVYAQPALADTAAATYELFGKTSAELFPLSNLSIATWLLLISAPSWEYTKYAALVAPVINALLYASAIVFLLTHPDPNAPAPDITTLEGIVMAFRNPDGVYAGWLHYCVFDPLVGLGEVLDSQQQKVPHWMVVPCLILTLLFGPVGFLSYLTVRTLTIVSRGSEN
eukprot:TRINITY_DN27049_c0_g1_i2.p1 TRINITY_DN27049_c0_g1~~TRINITY_DN27049_c0_g1_i2.p1  ORF type:complete len:231 (-),score=30.44 TRINITY_DN27049_c0_g1_i2:206-898(-)